MARHGLTDEQWKRIEELLPSREGLRGRPWNDHRSTIDGILWVLMTGAPWRDLPEEFGSWKSAYDRFNRWSKDGTWDLLVDAVLGELLRAGVIDRDLWCIDGSSVRASSAAAGGGKKGAWTNRKTMRSVALAAVMERSSTSSATAVETRSR